MHEQQQSVQQLAAHTAATEAASDMHPAATSSTAATADAEATSDTHPVSGLSHPHSLAAPQTPKGCLKPSA